MGFLQNLSKRIFSPYKHLLTTDQAKRWYQISQIIYFLSATCLAVHLINQITDKNKEDLKDDELEIVDHSRAHKRLRNSNVEFATITSWSPIDGFKTQEYHRDQYYQTLELEALERLRKKRQMEQQQ